MTITRLRTALFTIAVTRDGAALDLTGKVLRFDAASSANILISKSSASAGITIASPESAGIATLHFDPADTDMLPNIQKQTLVWELGLIDGSNVYQLATGQLNVLSNVR